MKKDPETQRLEWKLLNRVARACVDFDLIADGDRLMVCVSGGKDSYALLDLLIKIRARAPLGFDMVAANLDQGQPGFSAHTVEEHLKSLGVPYRMLKEDTYSIVAGKVEAEKARCWLCSRMRRGILYNAAVELGCTKIALGHHRDDLIETLLMSAFYAGSLKSMPPKLVSDDGRNVVIRPLAYCAEEDIAAYARAMGYPIVPCGQCGSEDEAKRSRVKRLLAELEAETPGLKSNLLHALQRVVPEHLMDRRLCDFGKQRRASLPPAPGH